MNNDGLVQLRVAYRELNVVTVKVAHKICELSSFGLIRQKAHFSALDAHYGYLQVEIEHQDKDKRRLDRSNGCTDFYKCCCF